MLVVLLEGLRLVGEARAGRGACLNLPTFQTFDASIALSLQSSSSAIEITLASLSDSLALLSVHCLDTSWVLSYLLWSSLVRNRTVRLSYWLYLSALFSFH